MTTPLQVIAYTMKEYNMSLEEALEHVKGKRSVVNPNDGFVQQLKDYEGILRARWVWFTEGVAESFLWRTKSMTYFVILHVYMYMYSVHRLCMVH